MLGGGTVTGRPIKAVLSGVSNPVLTAADLDAPVSYEGLAAVGSGLGSAGFIVFDDSRSMLSVARMVSRFLYVESCGQCRACKFGTGEITRRLDALAGPEADSYDIEVIGQRLRNAAEEFQHWKEYDYILVNRDLDKSFARLRSILTAERLKRVKMPKLESFVDGLLADLKKIAP